MTSTGSARIRHSHNDHREGRIVEKARRGLELGNEARICTSGPRQQGVGTSVTGLTGLGALGRGRETVFEFWGASVVSGSFVVRT